MLTIFNNKESAPPIYFSKSNNIEGLYPQYFRGLIIVDHARNNQSKYASYVALDGLRVCNFDYTTYNHIISFIKHIEFYDIQKKASRYCKLPWHVNFIRFEKKLDKTAIKVYHNKLPNAPLFDSIKNAIKLKSNIDFHGTIVTDENIRTNRKFAYLFKSRGSGYNILNKSMFKQLCTELDCEHIYFDHGINHYEFMKLLKTIDKLSIDQLSILKVTIK